MATGETDPKGQKSEVVAAGETDPEACEEIAGRGKSFWSESARCGGRRKVALRARFETHKD